jgi:hypothetical protein
MHALILGARAPACLEWTRALQHEQWQVSTADSLRWPLSRFSEAGKNYYRLPEPRQNPQAWIDALKKLVSEKKIDWIIPTCEEVFYLAWGSEQLRDYCNIFTSDFALLQQLHHKFDFAKLTQNFNLTAPESFLVRNPYELKTIFREDGDWIVKPAFSRFATHTYIKPTASDLNNILPTANHPWVVQQFIAGKEHCSYSLVKQGQVMSHAVYHPKYRVGKGSGIYFEVTQPTEILEFVKSFAFKTRFTGQLAFDFMEDKNGKFFVLECNPRATSGIHLFNDQPRALTEIFKRAPLPEVEEHDPLPASPLPGGGVLLPTSCRVKSVPSPGKGRVRVGSSFFNDTIFQPTTHSRMSSMAMMLFALHKQGWKKSFWQDFKNAQDVISHSGEHKPHYAQLLCLLEMCGRAVKQRKGLLAAVTADIEWDGQELRGTDG